jgi:uroporphyrinogen-III decarboxylase
MTVKERICAAMHREDVDYLPCSIYFNSNLIVGKYKCSNLEDKTELALKLGVDPVIGLVMRYSIHHDVKISNWTENIDGKPYPILWQAWDTPEGRLTQAVYKDTACKEWQNIRWGDKSCSSLYKSLIESSEDISRFQYLFMPTTDQDHNKWLEMNDHAFKLARRYNLPIRATYGSGLANLLFIMGAENAILFALENPAGFEELAEIIHQRNMRNIELCHRSDVHILKRFGGYEMCNFFNPDIYRSVCVPRIKKEVEYAHALGMLIYYRVVTGMEPLLQDIAEIGFDCIEGGEPHLSQCSLEMWYNAFSDKASSWTGISTPVLLGGNDTEAVRKEVRHCIDVFDRKGFILGVTNSIRQHFPWENTLALVDEWKRLR